MNLARLNVVRVAGALLGNNQKKERMFRMTDKDFDFKFTIGTGNGGQNKQKTLTACHCSHKGSGAAGYAQDARDQLTNKRLAFERMVATKEFQAWLKMKIDAGNGKIEIEETDKSGNMVKRLVSHEEIK